MSRLVLKIVGCGLLALAAVIAGYVFWPARSPVAKSNPDALRILCFGDSITEGSGAEFQGGYRGPLKKMLTDAGLKCDFVGRRRTHGLADPEHEGRGGCRISRMKRREVREMFEANRNLDIIILLIGINDLIENRNSVEATISHMSELLDQCAQNAPKARIVVGNLVPNASDNPVNLYDPANVYVGSEDKVLKFNRGLPIIVESKKAAGINVELVDLHSRLSRKDLCDGIHPSRGGYTKIAEAWFRAIIADNKQADRK